MLLKFYRKTTLSDYINEIAKIKIRQGRVDLETIKWYSMFFMTHIFWRGKKRLVVGGNVFFREATGLNTIKILAE